MRLMDRRVVAGIGAIALGVPALAGNGVQEVAVDPTLVQTQPIVWQGRHAHTGIPFVPRDPCPQVTSSVAAGYASISTGNQITLQAGMLENEGFGTTYTVPDPVPGGVNDAFPIEINQVEFIAGTAATVAGSDGSNIRLGWTLDVWDGEPGVGTSSVVFSVESDPDPTGTGLPADLLIPRVPNAQACSQVQVILGGAPASVVRAQFSVDQTADPTDRIFVPGAAQDGSGNRLNTFTIVVRITRHNVPSSGCSSVDLCQNAFLATESPSNAGTDFYSRDWLYAVPCSGGCPSGYTRFSSLSSSCRPSHDVLQQVVYTPAFCAGATAGACCATSGTCSTTTQSACTGSNTYQGDNTTCSPNPCPQPGGACCFGTSCLTANATDCAGAGGTYQGAGNSCVSGQCPSGACCITSTGVCSVTTPAACMGQGGVFRGAGVVCNTTSCPLPTGACCASNGFCLGGQTEADCTNAGLVWRGGGTVCSPNPCSSASGVCCRGASCTTGVAQANCTSPGTGIGAAFVSASSACNASGNTTGPCCYADFNKVNSITVQDIFDFLNAWFAGSPYCIPGGNGTGQLTVQNIFDYLNAWFSGGC